MKRTAFSKEPAALAEAAPSQDQTARQSSCCTRETAVRNHFWRRCLYPQQAQRAVKSNTWSPVLSMSTSGRHAGAGRFDRRQPPERFPAAAAMLIRRPNPKFSCAADAVQPRCRSAAREPLSRREHVGHKCCVSCNATSGGRPGRRERSRPAQPAAEQEHQCDIGIAERQDYKNAEARQPQENLDTASEPSDRRGEG